MSDFECCGFGSDSKTYTKDRLNWVQDLEGYFVFDVAMGSKNCCAIGVGSADRALVSEVKKTNAKFTKLRKDCGEMRYKSLQQVTDNIDQKKQIKADIRLNELGSEAEEPRFHRSRTPSICFDEELDRRVRLKTMYSSRGLSKVELSSEFESLGFSPGTSEIIFRKELLDASRLEARREEIRYATLHSTSCLTRKPGDSGKGALSRY